MAQRAAFVDNGVGCAAAVVAVRGLCAVRRACCVAVGSIIREAVAQRAAHVGSGICFAAAVVAFRRLRAIRCARGVAVGDIICKAMSQRAAHIGNSVGLGASDAFRCFRTVSCAGSIAVRSILAPIMFSNRRFTIFMATSFAYRTLGTCGLPSSMRISCFVSA